jgi:IS5 family transposase
VRGFPDGRNHLKGRDGDRANAVLAAAGYNFSLVLRWLERLLRALLAALWRFILIPRLA